MVDKLVSFISNYFHLWKAYTKSQMSYQVSYRYEMIGMAMMTVLHILSIYFLFDKFNQIGGWNFWEVVYLYGLTAVCLGIAQMMSSGLSYVPQFVRTGEFDRYLLRPLSPLLHILPHAFALHRIGRVVQGFLALVFALYMSEGQITGMSLVIVSLTLLSTTLVFFSLFIMSATCSFWTVQSSEVFNAFTYGGMEMSKFPVAIYQPWLRNLFLFIIPVGFVTYFPSVALFQKNEPLGFPQHIYVFSPIVAGIFFFLSIRFWNFGLKHYQSTGS